jgi:Na+-driven multidrug efflux pump
VSRGAGNMMVPAFAIAIGEAFHLALSPALILGWGPFPQLGIVGAALAALSAYAVGTLVLLIHLVSRQALVRLRLGRVRLKREEAWAILRVGGLSAMSALLLQATTFFVAGLVARLGSPAVAGYGAAVRLELLQYPITFAFGSAVIIMVATAVGARDYERARRAAWTGVAVTSCIGLVFTAIALMGSHWMALFSRDPEVRALGTLYLHCQALVFPFTGAALACYFATVGLGSVTGPFLLGLTRTTIAVAGGWLALEMGGGPLGLILASSVAFVSFALGMLVILRRLFDRLAR